MVSAPHSTGVTHAAMPRFTCVLRIRTQVLILGTSIALKTEPFLLLLDFIFSAVD